jgi:S-adenosylmethionine:tRNA ribosyltransferase-isomerase
VNVGKYFFEITQKKPYGKATASFNGEVVTVIGECGMVPLPPYIKNRDISAERYQTVYAEKNGSAAAPTAGLHFTEATIASLKSRGVVFAKVSLDIGLDTFRPIVEDDIEDHVIHSENFHIDANEAAKISEARKAGNRIIAVGTTSMRVIETVFDENGGISEYSGSTSLYIYPGYRFKIADALLTNFHLPYSTLLVMVSAFAGRENILRAYEEAKAGNYRFFSFGDCMFIY